MAESKEIKLRQVCSNKVMCATLVGVGLNQLDLETADGVFRFFTISAQTDSELSSTEADSMRYVVNSTQNSLLPGPSKRISARLKVIGDLVEDYISNDPAIKEQDDIVIGSAINREAASVPAQAQEETDAPLINFGAIKTHLFDVLKKFFSKEEVLKCTPLRLLINFALVLKYFYNFFKRLLWHGEELLLQFLPEQVRGILCKIISFLLEHLVNIGWRMLVQNAGGLMKMAGLLTLGSVTQQFLPDPTSNAFFGLGIAAVGVGVVSLGIGAYLRYYNI